MKHELEIFNKPASYRPTVQEREDIAERVWDMINTTGELTNTEAFVLADHLEKIANRIKSLTDLPAESEAFGAKVIVSVGRDTVDYSKDAEILELQAQIDERKKLLKTAFETKGIILDESGVLVPKPPTKPGDTRRNIEYPKTKE